MSDDARPLSRAASAAAAAELPRAALAAIARALPPERIDEIWIFPPRRTGAGLSVVAVAATFDPAGDPERRTIVTARFIAAPGTRGAAPRLELSDDGAAPPERVARVVDGVIRRLDDTATPPRHAHVRGEPERWRELLDAVANSER